MLRQKNTVKYTLIVLVASSNKRHCIDSTNEQEVSTMMVLYLRGICGDIFVFHNDERW